MDATNPEEINAIPVIDLSKAPGEHEAWDRPKALIYLWAIFEMFFVTNPWQVSSNLRVKVLRLFGAEIGDEVIYRPRTRVKFPWKLHIGDRSWIGEGVWFHNQDHIYIANDVVISQETFVTTGSHAYRRDMALVCRPITISAGVWVTARCILLGGTTIGRSAVISPGSVIGPNVEIPENIIISKSNTMSLGTRFHKRTETVSDDKRKKDYQ